MAGYIKLHRNLLENPVTSEPEMAWLWVVMLLSTNHKDVKKYWNGEYITIKAGQFITGRKKLSKQTGLSENKIYRALKCFENEQQIKQQKNNRFTLITILNWQKYQGNGTTNEQQNEQQIDNKSTTDRQRIDTNKNDKNDKNDKNINVLDFWNSKKIVTHQDNKDMINQISIGIKKYGIENIKLAIDRYCEVLKSDFYYKHIWRLDKFLKQSNGVPNFLDDGEIWINYKQRDIQNDNSDLYKRAFKCYKDFQGGYCQSNYRPGDDMCIICKENKGKWRR